MNQEEEQKRFDESGLIKYRLMKIFNEMKSYREVLHFRDALCFRH